MWAAGRCGAAPEVTPRALRFAAVPGAGGGPERAGSRWGVTDGNARRCLGTVSPRRAEPGSGEGNSAESAESGRHSRLKAPAGESPGNRR